MLMIALTGTNMHAQADVAHLLLDLTTQAGLSVSIIMGVQSASEVRALRTTGGHTVALWRIGQDDGRQELDGLLTGWLNDAPKELLSAVYRDLEHFLCTNQLPPARPALAHRHAILQAP